MLYLQTFGNLDFFSFITSRDYLQQQMLYLQQKRHIFTTTIENLDFFHFSRPEAIHNNECYIYNRKNIYLQQPLEK